MDESAYTIPPERPRKDKGCRFKAKKKRGKYFSNKPSKKPRTVSLGFNARRDKRWMI